jgi:hypothetical protein
MRCKIQGRIEQIAPGQYNEYKSAFVPQRARQVSIEKESIGLLFRKRHKRVAPPSAGRAPAPETASQAPAFYPITFDMMQKGAVIRRKGREVKQYAVSIGGIPRLVTSGDTVDRKTYEALVAAGALVPLSGEPANGAAPPAAPRTTDPEE